MHPHRRALGADVIRIARRAAGLLFSGFWFGNHGVIESLKAGANSVSVHFMSNANADPVYRDSSTNYTRWLIERILEDRAETAPPPEPEDAGDD
jgi:hypothetical protein